MLYFWSRYINGFRLFGCYKNGYKSLCGWIEKFSVFCLPFSVFATVRIRHQSLILLFHIFYRMYVSNIDIIIPSFVISPSAFFKCPLPLPTNACLLSPFSYLILRLLFSLYLSSASKSDSKQRRFG